MSQDKPEPPKPPEPPGIPAGYMQPRADPVDALGRPFPDVKVTPRKPRRRR